MTFINIPMCFNYLLRCSNTGMGCAHNIFLCCGDLPPGKMSGRKSRHHGKSFPQLKIRRGGRTPINRRRHLGTRRILGNFPRKSEYDFKNFYNQLQYDYLNKKRAVFSYSPMYYQKRKFIYLINIIFFVSLKSPANIL